MKDYLFTTMTALEMHCSDGEVILTEDYTRPIPDNAWSAYSTVCDGGFVGASLLLQPDQGGVS